MAKTILDAHTALAYRLGENGAPTVSTELARRLDWFKRAINIAVGSDDLLWFMQTKSTAASQANVQSYSLPSTFRKMIQVKVGGYKYEEVPQDEVYERFEVPLAPVPILPSYLMRAFYIFGDTYTLIPTPASAPTAQSVYSLTSASTTATATISAGHGYTTGDYVTIAGANESAYNGKFQITVSSSTVFTYTLSTTTTSPATGTITATKDDIELWYYTYPTEPTGSSSGIVVPDNYLDILVSYAEARYWSMAHKRAKAADAFTEFQELLGRLRSDNFKKKFHAT